MSTGSEKRNDVGVRTETLCAFDMQVCLIFLYPALSSLYFLTAVLKNNGQSYYRTLFKTDKAFIFKSSEAIITTSKIFTIINNYECLQPFFSPSLSSFLAFFSALNFFSSSRFSLSEHLEQANVM